MTDQPKAKQSKKQKQEERRRDPFAWVERKGYILRSWVRGRA